MTGKTTITAPGPGEPSTTADVAAARVRRSGNLKSPGARATRKWRARKAAGVRLVHVDLAEAEVDDSSGSG